MLVLGAYLRWTPRALVEDLRPWPDAIEYEGAARSLAEGGGYLLWIGDLGYPPRYPPGLSLLIAGSMPLVGSAPGCGIWVVLASALAAIAGTYALACAAAGPTAGIVAALLLATSPLHVPWSRAVMSDVPASAAVAWLAAWIVVLLKRRAGVLEHVALGLACGLAVSIRQPLAMVAPAACIIVALLSAGTPRVRARNTIVLAAGIVLGVLPLMWLNTELFGHPLSSGYGYWVPGAMFSLARVATARPSGIPSNAWQYGAMLVGDGASYPWTAAVLLLMGTLAGLRRPGAVRSLALLAWLVTVLFLALHLPYSGLGSRLVVPILPLLAAVMAIPFVEGARVWQRTLACALVAATLLLESTRPDAYAPPNAPVHDVATLEKIAAIAEPDAAILAHANTISFARVLRRNADRVWVPLGLDAHQGAIEHMKLAPLRRGEGGGGWIRKPLRRPFDRDAAIATVADLCLSGRPVYLSEQLGPRVAFLGKLERALRARFRLTQVVAPEPYAVFRIECAAVDGAPLAQSSGAAVR